jgi:NTE family protein
MTDDPALAQPTADESEAGRRATADALAKVPLFEGMPEPVVASLAEKAERIAIPAGTEIIRQGDTSTDLFVVRTGRLAAYRLGRGGVPEKQAEIFAGETVGEMAHLTGEPRSASVIALRDSELYRLRQRDLDALLARAPLIGLRVARVLARRIARMQDRGPQRSRPRCFAVAPHPGLADGGAAFVRRLAAALADFGSTIVVEKADDAAMGERFQALEATHRHVLLAADAEPTAWTAFCLRQSDVHVLVADANSSPAPWPALAAGTGGQALMPEREIALLRRDGERPSGSGDWLEAAPGATFLHHVKDANDEARLARFLARRATTLVLSGGGARGFAHLGAVKALVDSGIAIDAFGGSSMGAILAACYAAGWPHEEIVKRVRQAFVERRLLNDPIVPVVALFRGRRVDRLFEDTFGDLAIEDLPHPYFCVSTDLSRGRPAVHRRGLLRKWLRASAAVPGILRPLQSDGVIHVDGGVIDNLPVEAAVEQARGQVIGVDVGFDEQGDVRLSARPDVPLWQSWLGGRTAGEPSIIEVLWRVGTIGNAAQQAEQEEAALIIRPPIREVGFLDWRKLDRAMAIGYEHTMKKIAERRAQFTATYGG